MPGPSVLRRLHRFTLPIVLVLALSACTGSASPTMTASTGGRPATTTSTPPTTSPARSPAPTESASTAGEPQPRNSLPQTARIGDARYQPPTPQDPSEIPTSITIDGIDVSRAPVVEVGVLSNGEMEIPGATEVGWYRFGPSPGAQGSSVLAAHIAYNGRDGVFRFLADVDIGTVVEVGFADGHVERFQIETLTRYAKADLPVDELFRSDGDATLTLITCGGDFSRSLRSYDDNVVATAVPVD